MAPSAARSSHWRRSGSGRSANRPRRRASRFSAASSTKVTPAAASTPWPELQPGRLGLTTRRAPRAGLAHQVVVDHHHLQADLGRRR